MTEKTLGNVCPRCGRTGYIKIQHAGNRSYYYFVHYLGKGKKKYCYVGPVGEYYVVNEVYADKALDLQNVMHVDFGEVAQKAIKNYVDAVTAKINAIVTNVVEKAENEKEVNAKLQEARETLKKARETLKKLSKAVNEALQSLPQNIDELL